MDSDQHTIRQQILEARTSPLLLAYGKTHFFSNILGYLVCIDDLKMHDNMAIPFSRD